MTPALLCPLLVHFSPCRQAGRQPDRLTGASQSMAAAPEGFNKAHTSICGIKNLKKRNQESSRVHLSLSLFLSRPLVCPHHLVFRYRFVFQQQSSLLLNDLINFCVDTRGGAVKSHKSFSPSNLFFYPQRSGDQICDQIRWSEITCVCRWRPQKVTSRTTTSENNKFKCCLIIKSCVCIK